MKFKQWFIRYNYLVRTSCTLILALCIPLTFLGYMVIRSSYEEIKTSSQNYYLDNIQTLAQRFEEETASMIARALEIGMEHKVSRQIIESHPWEIVEASRHLASYNAGKSSTDDLGLLFNGADYIITTEYKYSLPDYIEKYTQGNEVLTEKMQAFFNSPFTASSYFSTFYDSEANRDGLLFFRVPIRLSSNTQKDAAILFSLNQETLENRLLGLPKSDLQTLEIYDRDGNLFFSNASVPLTHPDLFKNFISDVDATVYTDENSTNTYKFYDSDQGLTFSLTVQRELVEKNLFSFYATLQTILLLTGILIPLVLIPTIHLNYRPVLSLLRKVQKVGENEVEAAGELRTIEAVFDKMKNEKDLILRQADEQKLALTDYALHQLLNDGMLSQTEKEILHILPNSFFCTAAVWGLQLDHISRQKISASFLKICHAQLYIIDMPNESYHVFLTIFSSLPSEIEISNHLKEILASVKYERLGVGHIVNTPEEIHLSYLSALSVLQTPTKNITYSEITGDFKQTLFYPFEEIHSFLQYISCANTSKALHFLHQAILVITNQNYTLAYKKFICNNILSDYVKTLYSVGLEIDRETISQMANFKNAVDFEKMLSVSTQQACQAIEKKKQDASSAFNQSIVSYIDQNYMKEDTCLVSVADHFGISIYTLSRIFKETTGHRFKEYITKRRLEYGKYLLLTTNHSIKSIAQMVGLQNADYFSKLFKEHYQTLPSKLRS